LPLFPALPNALKLLNGKLAAHLAPNAQAATPAVLHLAMSVLANTLAGPLVSAAGLPHQALATGRLATRLVIAVHPVILFAVSLLLTLPVVSTLAEQEICAPVLLLRNLNRNHNRIHNLQTL
jgi:hypothetical protein